MRVKIILKDYVGAYELNDEFEVIGFLDDGSAKIIDNDGNEDCLWTDEFEVIQ